MLESVQLYEQPFGSDTYSEGPTDAQACALARALAHWFSYYRMEERDLSAKAIVLDILDSNALSDPALSRDECELIADVFGLEI